MKNIFAGSLAYAMTGEDLEALFAEFGEVAHAKIITDRDTGRSKGFGFVEMPNDDEANKAIENLNGTEQHGRTIVVNEARPRPDKPRRHAG